MSHAVSLPWRTALHLHFCPQLCAPNDISNAALVTACEALAKNHGGRKKFFKKIDLKCSQRLTRDAFYWVSIISSPTKPCPATSKDRGCQWNMATSMLAKLQVLEHAKWCCTCFEVLDQLFTQKQSDSIAAASKAMDCVEVMSFNSAGWPRKTVELHRFLVLQESFVHREINDMSCWESPSTQSDAIVERWVFL